MRLYQLVKVGYIKWSQSLLHVTFSLGISGEDYRCVVLSLDGGVPEREFAVLSRCRCDLCVSGNWAPRRM